jgi:hypothetical protein
LVRSAHQPSCFAGANDFGVVSSLRLEIGAQRRHDNQFIKTLPLA